MLIAGEASGDTLGAELVKALKHSPALASAEPQFFGAGGPKMAAEGVELAFDLTAHAVVGVVEVLKSYRTFKSFFDQLLLLAEQRKPDAIVLIDYPGFNLRFAEVVKNTVRSGSTDWQPKIAYYVSPQIWAWHESRIEQIARDIDLMLAIIPFEKAWYQQRKPNFRVEFVGHPLIDRFQEFHSAETRRKQAAPLLLLLPGSRVRELRKHLPPMLAAARKIRQHHRADIRMVLPSDDLRALAESFLSAQDDLQLIVGALPDSLSIATAAIASSGTVTVECAFFRVPTVVLYKTSWSTYLLGRRFINVKYLAMPNLLADKVIFPEFIQHRATAENLAQAAIDLLTNPARQTEIKRELDNVIASLGEPGASTRAAAAILALFA